MICLILCGAVMKPLLQNIFYFKKSTKNTMDINERGSEFENLVMNLIYTFTINLHQQWSQCNKTITFLTKNIQNVLKNN